MDELVEETKNAQNKFFKGNANEEMEMKEELFCESKIQKFASNYFFRGNFADSEFSMSGQAFGNGNL